MSKILYVIDGYLSSQNKSDVTIELIEQLRKLDPSREIMLVNKFNKSWGIENMVDYYREYTDGFMVGYPPKEILDSKSYDKPYVYFETTSVILENWMPLTGVSDHVANVYNGFIYSSREAKNVGYEKVFRVEYDMLFDESEFLEILEDLSKFEDEEYLIYGVRHEGVWAKKDQGLIDLHFCGYSEKMLKNFDFVSNDDEYWNLCSKIGYTGKWSEYVMYKVFKTNTNENLFGSVYEKNTRNRFPKSNFDRISSSGEWTDKWKLIPKLCKLDVDNGSQPDKSKIAIFYLNLDYDNVTIETISNANYYKKLDLGKGGWFWHLIDIQKNMVFMTRMTFGDQELTWVEHINNETYDKLNCRLILKK
jgi:hypothetical protein